MSSTIADKSLIKRNFQARLAVFFYFLYAGSAVTVWAVNIPEVENRLAISHTELGALLVFIGLGALTSMQFMGRIIDRKGSRFATVLAGVFTGLAMILPGLATSAPWLAAALFVLGAGMGAGDVAMNAHAVEVERAYGRPIFSAFHAFWSFGGVLGSAIGGTAIALKVPMVVSMSGYGLTFMLLAIYAGTKLLPPQLTHQEVHAKLSKDESRKLRKSQDLANRKFLPTVILLGAMAGAGAFLEGTGVDWSSLYQVRVLGASSATGALAVMAFSFAMASFRLVADRVVAARGRLVIIRFGPLVSAAGVSIALIAPTAELALVGWFLAGLGISAVVPQIFAISAVVGEASHSGRNMATVVGLCYAGVLGGPAIIGLLTAVMPLQVALTFGILLGVLITLGSIRLAKAVKA
ncbi:MAG: MFS transporter [Rhodoluna sp.]